LEELYLPLSLRGDERNISDKKGEVLGNAGARENHSFP
jgi:hypothetical protein